MNIKKIFFIIISVLIISAIVILPTTALAAYDTPIYLGITELKTGSTPNIGYAIGNPNANTSTSIVAAKIWNIVKYSSETSNDPTEANFYCVKAGVGFSDTHKKAAYDRKYDLKTQKTNIAAQNSVLSSLVNGGYYNHLLALVDMLYIPEDSTDAEKITLLESAGINEDDWDFALTDDDIEAVQQAAIWYFTNYGDSVYDKYNSTAWLNYTTDGSTYTSLSGYYADTAPNANGNTNSGAQRQSQAEMLYKYLIDTAKANASKYDNASTIGAPITINTTTLNAQTKGDNFIVGPINITKNNDLAYELNLLITNESNTTISNYSLLDENQTATTKTVKELVEQGKDFYIQIPKTAATTINVKINASYKTTTATLYASSTNNEEQPVILVEKETKPIEVPLSVTPDQKIFDLALRKYITKVNGVDVTDSRVPVIDKTTLSTGTTATYKHRKDPVIVENGNTVTYKLTIYNEGEKAGRATKVVDQLPTGLQFSKVVSGNFEKSSYDETTNRLELTRKSGNEENLAAYDATTQNLASETIEIECIVTAKPDTENNKVLTNVAWISEEFNAEDNVTITNQSNADRDSEPLTTPNVNKDSMSNYTGNGNKSDLTDSEYYYKGQQDDDDFEKLVLLPKSFDLKLIKRITEVNGEAVPERIESVDVSKLNTLDENGKMITTADYILTKDPVSVKKGDIVTYTFRIYNEGDIDGYASEITEDIPEGLEFIYAEDTSTLSEQEKAAVDFNNSRLWTISKTDTNMKVTEVSSDYLSKESETTEGGNLIKAFGSNDGTKTENDISYKEISIKLKVVADDVTGIVIRNEAEISDDEDADGNDVTDRDSTPEEWKKDPSDKYYDEDKKWPIYKEDDEDYDNIKLQSFDLALRKFIIAVSDDETIEETEYLKNTNGSYTRAPQVDTSKLNTKDEEGNTITTAIYNHPKTPVEVRKNDYVVYSLRVYNEGEIDGYATEITDHLPPYLEFVDGEYNKKYGWTVSEDGRTVKTKYLENSKIKAAEKLPEMVGAYVDEDGNIIGSGGSTGYVLSYVEVPIMCKVTDKAKTNEAITNIADITEFKDENKKDINDRDSEKDNVKLPEDDKLPTYKDEEKGTYVPGQQDDDDFEKVIIKRFDLALRKFITEVNENEVTTRIPEIKYDKENNKITYEHTKEPVEVVSSDIVTYTIRVFNEGEVDGYAKEVMDDIPEGLEFLPENETNTEYRWVMYEEVKDEKEVEDASKIIERDGKKYIETKEASKASIITTDYLSKEQGEARMKEDSTIKENPALLTAFDTSKEISETNPDYADVKVAFKVIEPNTSDKIIINSAQISEDSDKNGKDIDDDDSIPGKWNEGEDDQDKEYIKLTYFDLALRKWVTQAIVIEDGKETVTNTGHDAWDDPEEVVKVELNRKKLSNITVKFKYSIRIYNQGDIAGYAKEITDYVPEGLKFVAEDNPGWTDEGNNVISTRLLENTLLQPGEYADVEVLLTWINGQDNIGLKTNTAEISEDYNDKHAKDIDSTPDNKKPGEDDIDDAPVILSISTGQVRIYFILGFTVLITIAGGIVLIKKYVL